MDDDTVKYENVQKMTNCNRLQKWIQYYNKKTQHVRKNGYKSVN